MSQVGLTERNSGKVPIAGPTNRNQLLDLTESNFSEWLKRGLESLVVAIIYIGMAKLSLALASVNPSATPVWPPTGYALAMMLLLGYRVAPAIFFAALITNATTAGSVYTWLGIATGNTLESVVGAYLVKRFSDGWNTFATPVGVAKFALISFVPSTLVSATVGVGSLSATGYAAWPELPSIWMTWWMGDLAGALVITPAILLWAQKPYLPSEGSELIQSGLVHVAAVAVGLIAFSPIIEQTPTRTPLAFLAVLPLMWAALRSRQRDTASVGLLLSAFAVWGTVAANGPFAQKTENDSFLLLLAFMISVSVPSLALSAEVTVRKSDERHIKFLMHELSHRSKNLLAVVQSMANQIARRTDNFESFQSGLIARLQSLSKTHDLLVQVDWEGTGIHDLVRVQLAPFHNLGDRSIIAEGPELKLHAKAAEQLGFALYELGTNAAKYGALSLRAGSVRVRWRLESEDTRKERLRLTWEEVCGPAVSQPQRDGFGTLVLTKLVPMSLGGIALLTFEPKGLNWLLLAPATSVLAAN
jgi:two-component sensor histidine kinase